MKTWMVQIIDEQSGFVRYTEIEVQAETEEEAIEKENLRSKDWPGWYVTGAIEKR